MGLFDDLIPQQQRAPVQPSRRVWGDAEAEAAGLYETREGQVASPVAAAKPMLSFDDLIPKQTASAAVSERFPEQTYQNEGLATDVSRAARQLTTGPRTSSGQHVAIDFANQQSAAGQGTTPNVDAQYKNIVSDQVFENDAGEAQYRDSSGRIVTTDKNKHVILRDPADNRLKVFARSEDTDEGALSASGRLLMSGMAAGAATARPAIAAASKPIQPMASDIMATAKPYYRAFRDEAGAIAVPFETAQGIAERLRTALGRVNLTEEMAGAPAKAALQMLERGQVITLDDLQKVKRFAGRGFNNSEKDARDAAAAISGEVGKIISEVSREASRNLKTGDAIHSTAMAVQDLQRKGSVADLRAGRAGYGGNAVNSMRQVLSPIVQRAVEGKTTSFKPDEIQAMREIVEGTTVTNTLRGIGQLSPSKGIMQTAGAGGAAYALGPAALAIPALGATSNKLATILTGQQIDRLKELVAKRSPEYAKAVEKATERYERAQLELINNPAPAKFAAYLSASRALSSGLQRDGIQITSGELLRSIQGPVKAAADDEQPQPVGVGN